MITIVLSGVGFSLLLALAAWMHVRGLFSFGPGQGSVAPGVTYMVQPSVTPVAASSGDVAAAQAVATLPAATGKMTYIEGFDLTGGGATAASVVVATVTGLPTAVGTLTFDIAVPAGATAGIGTNGIYSIRFPTPIPASALNTSPVVTVPSLGSGNTHACVTAYGFQA